MLRDYQLDIALKAVELLKLHRIAYLSMQVRTGKTVTSMAAAKLYGARRVLFLTKKKAISSIQGDYDSFKFEFNLTVLNYEQINKVVLGMHDLVILDEAHSLGQFPVPAKKIKKLKAICNGLPIIYLSGTPTPESYSQIYHQFYVSSFSPFAEYISFYKWARDFVQVRTKYFFNRSMNDYSHALKHKIDEATAHLFLSFTQSEAGFIQEVDEKVCKVEMKLSTTKLAQKLKNDRVYQNPRLGDILADTEVKLMQKLHQIYSGTVKNENGEGIAFDDSKAHFIKHKFAGQKIAIFYKFIAELKLLRHHFGDKLTESPEAFRDSDDKVFISQIQSGREGINLSTADALIMYNIDFSSVSYQQARARIQAKDRIKPCNLYWIFSDGGIEEKIYRRVINKQDYTLSYFKKDYL